MIGGEGLRVGGEGGDQGVGGEGLWVGREGLRVGGEGVCGWKCVCMECECIAMCGRCMCG